MFEDPTWCTVVLVGGPYVNRMVDVMQFVENIKYETKMIPQAVLVYLTENHPENIFSEGTRDKDSPTVVSRGGLRDPTSVQ